ncbi:MAG: PEP-CTERM sorting domain-containing protein [Phycisphaerae bacterium]
MEFLVDHIVLGDTFTSVIPEPATLAILGVTGMGLLLRRRR